MALDNLFWSLVLWFWFWFLFLFHLDFFSSKSCVGVNHLNILLVFWNAKSCFVAWDASFIEFTNLKTFLIFNFNFYGYYLIDFFLG